MIVELPICNKSVFEDPHQFCLTVRLWRPFKETKWLTRIRDRVKRTRGDRPDNREIRVTKVRNRSRETRTIATARRVATSRLVASRIKATSQASAKAVREEARTGNRFGGAGWVPPPSRSTHPTQITSAPGILGRNFPCFTIMNAIDLRQITQPLSLIDGRRTNLARRAYAPAFCTLGVCVTFLSEFVVAC